MQHLSVRPIAVVISPVPRRLEHYVPFIGEELEADQAMVIWLVADLDEADLCFGWSEIKSSPIIQILV